MIEDYAKWLIVIALFATAYVAYLYRPKKNAPEVDAPIKEEVPVVQVASEEVVEPKKKTPTKKARAKK